jgi:hypothetical protein
MFVSAGADFQTADPGAEVDNLEQQFLILESLQICLRFRKCAKPPEHKRPMIKKF